jgi:hypothetical protein
MKSIILKTILFLMISLNFFGCISVHKGEFIQPFISSNKQNFRIVKTIRGESMATYILGIGGNSRDGLINEAKKSMYISYTIKPNQNITNVTTDIKNSYFIVPFIFMTQTAIVSADVIEFYDLDAKAIDSKSNDEKANVEVSKDHFDVLKNEKTEIFNDTTKSKLFRNINEVEVGDKILVQNPKGIIINGIVTKILKDNIVQYKYKKRTGDYFTDEVGLLNIRKYIE